MKPDWTNARSADGPTVKRWLCERFPQITSEAMRSDPFAAVVASWDRPNRLVDFYTLDRWLTPRGLFLCELPDECWRWAKPKTPPSARDLCERVVAEYAAGIGGRNYLARVHGIPRRRIDKWIRGVEVAA